MARTRWIRAQALGLLSMLVIPASGDSEESTLVQNHQNDQAEGIRLEMLFPEKPLLGKKAREIAWSHDDRYLAYLWNQYEDTGFDLWVHDTISSTSERITSVELMARFDREATEILERYQKEKMEEERRRGLSEQERRRLGKEDRQRERDEEAKQRWEKRYSKKTDGSVENEEAEEDPEYVGISSFAWANRTHELLFSYQGDLFRVRLGDSAPMRLTHTHEAESDVRYANDDSGFFFRRGNGVFRASFSSPILRELNPELPKKMTMQSYELSPDESKILIVTSRQTAPLRKVNYLTYRDRFAETKTAERSVADDPYKNEFYLFVYDLDDDPLEHPQHDGEPWQIYFWPDGEEFGRTSIAEDPWAPDSGQLVFATWRDKSRELAIVVADVEARTVQSVFIDQHQGGPDTPIVAKPFFSPAGDRIVTVLEKTGFRHPWLIDPLTKEAHQLTQGTFEVYPQKFSNTGDVLLVRSDRENPARMDVYTVSVGDGTMTRLTARNGVYEPIIFSHDHRHFATIFSSWNEPHELCLVDVERIGGSNGREASVTQSHPVSLSDVLVLAPELFTYDNRHGQTIRGFVFHPPGWQQTDTRPLLIYVYGGPLITRKQVTDGNFHSSAYLFNMYLALKHGYVTATIDPRGNSGYGAVFESANWENIGTPQTEDLIDGVRTLIEHHGVDPDRVGLNGWSFGGFQTQHAMYTAPDIFKLGIAGAGPTEWQNYNTWYANTFVGDSPVGDPTELDQYSLTRLAKNLRSPLLLLHGMEDTNVLFQDTVFVYRELLNYGKGPLVELVLDPTGGHGLGGDIQALDRYQIYEAFLMKHWGPYR